MNTNVVYSLFLITLSLTACGKSGSSPATQASQLASDINPPKEREQVEKKPETKEEPASEGKAQVRRLITNTQDKVTREQANLARREQLRDNLRSRRDIAREELAEASKTQMSGSNGNTRRTKEELEKLIAQQEADIKLLEDEIKESMRIIDELEKQIDELTLKL